MSPRTGRPTTDPKSNWTGFRLSDNDIQKLNYCIKETGMSKAEIVRKGIDATYRNESLKRRETRAMKNKYNGSFKVDDDDIPRKCPICGTKFDLIKDVDISSYKDGLRSVLFCPKCNFQKVLSYTTKEDIEKEMENTENDEEEEEKEKMTKEEMIAEMKEMNWPYDVTEKSSWDEVKEQYDIMMDEYSDDSTLFPNGRDYDAEDEDGPF